MFLYLSYNSIYLYTILFNEHNFLDLLNFFEKCRSSVNEVCQLPMNTSPHSRVLWGSKFVCMQMLGIRIWHAKAPLQVWPWKNQHQQKTKRKVAMNSTMRAWMQSSWVASQVLPSAILAMAPLLNCKINRWPKLLGSHIEHMWYHMLPIYMQ